MEEKNNVTADASYPSGVSKVLDTEVTPVSEKKKDALAKELRVKRNRDREKVKGIFRYIQKPGKTLNFSFYNHKGDAVENYTLVDGQTYTLRRDVARHLNTEGLMPQREWIKNEAGNNVLQITKYQPRCTFNSLDFFELEDITPKKRILPVHTIEGKLR